MNKEQFLQYAKELLNKIGLKFRTQQNSDFLHIQFMVGQNKQDIKEAAFELNQKNNELNSLFDLSFSKLTNRSFPQKVEV